jgi:hypothetical protein
VEKLEKSDTDSGKFGGFYSVIKFDLSDSMSVAKTLYTSARFCFQEKGIN